MNIQEYYKYSQFSSLAYVDWQSGAVGFGADIRIAIADANAAERIPGASGGATDTTIDTLGEKIFIQDGWRIEDFHPNDAAGFKASLFTNSATGEKILGIAGTEPSSLSGAYTDLFKADLQEIGDYGMAISQAVSLFNYVQQLQGDKFAEVVQLELRIEKEPPLLAPYVVSGSGTGTRYISVWAGTGVGLGLLDPGDNVTITGHSLGGHLAAIGQRLFPGLFDKTVTYNAPGFDPNLGVSTTPSLYPWDFDAVSLGDKLTDEFIETLFKPYLTTPP